MTEPLAEIADFSQERDYDSLVGRHSELQDKIRELQSELETTLGPDSELDEDQIERIRDTYFDVVQSDLQSLLEGDYKLDEFCSAVDDVLDDIGEVLHNPKAETVAEEIDSWIVSTGLDPLSDDERQGLRQAIISDVEMSKTAVNRAKTAHGDLRGHLGPLQETVDRLLRAELTGVNAPSDIVDIADSLQSFESGWHGDWTLDHDLGVGKGLNEQIWSVLLEDLRDDVEDRESLSQAATLVDNHSDRISRKLSEINEAWADVEAEYRRLPDSVSYDEARLLTLLEEQLREDPSLSTYHSAIRALQEALENLIEIQNADIDEFHSDREPEIEDLQAPLEEVRARLEDATDIQSRALKADSVKEIKRLKEEELGDCLEELEDERDELHSRLVEKVKAVRRLSEKFDITTEEDLTGLYTDTMDQDEVDRLLELSERCATARQEVRSQIREDLPEAQAQLLEDLLTLSTDYSDINLSTIESELDYSDEESLFDGLLGLRENGLLDIEISVS